MKVGDGSALKCYYCSRRRFDFFFFFFFFFFVFFEKVKLGISCELSA